MKKIKVFSVFMVLILCINLLASYALAIEGEQPGELEINASAALLLEVNSNQVLFEHNASEKVYPASMTKIMTCLLTLENGTLNDTITVSETALQNLDAEGSTAGLKAGEILTVENLLYCMMLSSANEACNVAAEYVSGDINTFIALMNTRATELGCTGTNFANTHGLHDDTHYTTANDLAIITKEAMKNTIFRRLVSTASYTMPATNLSSERYLNSTNKLIVESYDNPHYDKRVTGVKTGYTTPAGRCLVATAEDGSLSLLSIVCGCETIILESGNLDFGSFGETRKLLQYGFENFSFATVLTTLYPVAEIPVSRSAGANFVSLAPQSEITTLMPSSFKESDLKFETTLVSDDGVTAPVAAGDELGTITVFFEGKKLGTVPLVAITDVERATLLTYLNPARYAAQGWLRITLLIVIFLCVILIVIILLIKKRKKDRKKKQKKMQRLQNNSSAPFSSHNWYERK